MKKGFTLIELLAVIVILAIIAAIAIPIVINIISTTKKEATMMSAKNYIKAVELSVIKENINTDIKNSNGIYKISNGGKIIQSKDKTFKIEYDGMGISEGIIVIKKGKVTQLEAAKIDKWYVQLKNGEINIADKYTESKLVGGQTFNSKIKTLVNNVSMTKDTEDTKIKTIEFLSMGLLPKGYTLETLQKLPSVDVSSNNDESIVAYNNNGEVYIYSEYLISFNPGSTYMFYNMNSIMYIDFFGIDTSKVTNMNSMFNGCSSLKTLDLSYFDTALVEGMSGMFSKCSSLESITFGKNFTAKSVTNMLHMFANCNSLTSLDLTYFDTNLVQNMGGMFSACNNLKSIKFGKKFSTKSVTTMAVMFSDCSNLKTLDLTYFDTDLVESMRNMFYNCSSLESIKFGSNFTAKSTTDMTYMFNGCSSLKTLDLSYFDTGLVEGMSGMFYKCSSLESITFGKNFTAKKVTNMLQMFLNCSSLKTLDLSYFDTGLVTNMGQMFNNCSSLESIKFGENFTAKSAQNTVSMFNGCSNLTSLDLTSFDTSLVTDMRHMFANTPNLKPIFIGKKWIIGENILTAGMFGASATKSMEELCEPNSTEEWCIIDN